MSTLTRIYELTNQDVIDFNSLNARPGNKVSVMSYGNDNQKSIVVCDIVGTAGSTLPGLIVITDNNGLNNWIASGNLVEVDGQYCIELDENGNIAPTVFDSNGKADNVYFESIAPAAVSADKDTLTVIATPSSNVSSVINPYPASASGQQYLQCVDKTTIDNPIYSDWKDAMESNQPISTREIYTLMV